MKVDQKDIFLLVIYTLILKKKKIQHHLPPLPKPNSFYISNVQSTH